MMADSEGSWDDFTRSCRGLIINTELKKVVALPFPKFFNYGEGGRYDIPNTDFKVVEKYDGSLIIVFWDEEKSEWRFATKGSFQSEQSQYAEASMKVNHSQIFDYLNKNVTYLFEFIYPENRIVVSYGSDIKFVFLGAYNSLGQDTTKQGKNSLNLYFDENPLKRGLHKRVTIEMAYEHPSMPIEKLLEIAQTLPLSSEGFVVTFDDDLGTRYKIKGDQYCRVHKVVSRVTPLAIWEAMLHGEDLDALRSQIPEEFCVDFDSIRRILTNKLNEHRVLVMENYEQAKGIENRDIVRLGFNKHQIFEIRKHEGDFDLMIRGFSMTKYFLFLNFRPTANRLAEYTPSNAMNRFSSEMFETKEA
jgi:RNA ligase